MKTYIVYRVDHLSNRAEIAGKLAERRCGARYDNTADMLRLAKKIYGTSTTEVHVFISSRRIS
jgi:hypothetical protein